MSTVTNLSGVVWVVRVFDDVQIAVLVEPMSRILEQRCATRDSHIILDSHRSALDVESDVVVWSRRCSKRFQHCRV